MLHLVHWIAANLRMVVIQEKEAPVKEILTVRQEVEAERQEKLRIFERIAKNESQRRRRPTRD